MVSVTKELASESLVRSLARLALETATELPAGGDVYADPHIEEQGLPIEAGDG